MSHFDVLQQAINAAKPVKIVALRARREYRAIRLENSRMAANSKKMLDAQISALGRLYK